MQIQKANSQQNPNFGTAVTLKTDDFKVVQKLVELGNLFHEQAHPKFEYFHVGLEVRPSNLFKGIIGDGDHKEVIEGFHKLSLSNRLRPQMSEFITKAVEKEGNKPVIITRIEQILDLPLFANCKDTIAEMIAKLK